MSKEIMDKMMGDLEALCGYVARNAGGDAVKLMLKSEPGLPFDKRFAVMQIECRKRAKNKIPSLLAHERYLFPKPISAEQCTHEEVARFHASLFRPTDRVLDMTMGLGVDSYYISRQVAKLTAMELDEEIAACGQHNFAFLAPDVKVMQGDSVAYVKAAEEQFDAIFVDPARRADSGARLYGLADCAPDVLGLLPVLQQRTKRLYIKASPMIDVSQSLRDLRPHLTQVWAVSVKNECKELFFCLDFERGEAPVTLHALNFDRERQELAVTEPELAGAQVRYGDPQVGQCLYEPNASVMKIGAYHALSQRYGVTQVAQNSHLYFSHTLVPDFPGRKFVVEAVYPFKDKEIKAMAKRCKMLNIATRNFRLSADALKKRLKVRDGGEHYLFATTTAAGEAIMLLTTKAR